MAPPRLVSVLPSDESGTHWVYLDAAAFTPESRTTDDLSAAAATSDHRRRT